jgi:hypothetical protein
MNISKSSNLSIAKPNDLQSIITLAQFIAASPAFGDEARKKLGKFWFAFQATQVLLFPQFRIKQILNRFREIY